jgi:ATP phosphoribosyltransferase-like protein
MNTNVQDLSSEAQRLNVSLDTDEKVLEIITKARGRVLLPLVALGIVGLALTLSIFIAPFVTPISEAAFAAFALVYGLVLLCLIFLGLSEWYAYRQSALLITNERIIDVHQTNFFFRKFQTVRLCEVKNTVPEITPGLGQFLHYGTVTIEIIANNNPMVIRYILVPDIVATEIMNYHTLHFHGGISNAHNFDAITLKDDLTPELANVLEQAEKVSLDKDLGLETETKASPVEPVQRPNDTASLLMFHVPKDKIDAVLKDLPSQKEPTVTFLDHTQYYQVQAIVPQEMLENVTKRLQDKGAEDLVKSDVEVLA